jgi:hypothetical protein
MTDPFAVKIGGMKMPGVPTIECRAQGTHRNDRAALDVLPVPAATTTLARERWVFLILIFLSGYEQSSRNAGPMDILDSARKVRHEDAHGKREASASSYLGR